MTRNIKYQISNRQVISNVERHKKTKVEIEHIKIREQKSTMLIVIRTSFSETRVHQLSHAKAVVDELPVFGQSQRRPSLMKQN